MSGRTAIGLPLRDRGHQPVADWSENTSRHDHTVGHDDDAVSGHPTVHPNGLDELRNTGTAVTAFKSDEALSPPDQVVARGTMSRLDAYFAHEPADPDSPEPLQHGFNDLAVTAMATASHWVTAALFALNNWMWDVLPDDPAWVDYDTALHQNFHIDRSTLDRRRCVGDVLLPRLPRHPPARASRASCT